MASSDINVLRQLNPVDYYREFIKNGVRADGRSFSDLRRVAVGTGDHSTSSAYGSSLAHIGETKVSCNVSVLVGTPSQQNPGSGDLGSSFSISLPRVYSCRLESHIAESSIAF